MAIVKLKIDRIIGIIVGLIAIASAFGAYYTIPYRVSQVEIAQAAAAKVHSDDTAAVRAEAAADRAKAAESKEMLIRIEERIKNMQLLIESEVRGKRFGGLTPGQSLVVSE